MSVLFDNIKPGDTVHYSTPQGQTGKGKVVMNRGTHLVLNAGGKHGRPQVVTDKNYIKHSRGGKVVGALLSRLKEDKALMQKHADWMKAQEKKRSDKAWEKVHDKMPGVITRLAARAKGTKLNKQGKVVEATWQGAGDPYNWDPVMRQQVFAAAAKKERAKQVARGQPVPHELDTGRPLKSKPAPFRRGMKEDSKDAEGAAERVAKTKKHKKKLHEVSTGTLASYVSKAIADRKKAQGGADMARRIHTPERAAYFVDKMTKKADKRSKGIKTAVAKIAKAYEARENEWAANQALSGQASKAAKGHYLMRDGRRLSGPHSPEDAVREYKKMSDSKGVKIVHVKETHHFDVTFELISEDKVKTAAKKAVDLKKKAKGNKHVDTEPKLDIADKGTAGAMEGSNEGGDNAVKL